MKVVLDKRIGRIDSLTIGERQPGRSSQPLGVARVMSMKMIDVVMYGGDAGRYIGVMSWMVIGLTFVARLRDVNVSKLNFSTLASGWRHQGRSNQPFGVMQVI